ncbi:RNA polymerase sigma factor [Virgisporangium aurantiacum]|uniref:RNA polymerase sigma factor n=1 Tax=Virgisporangium aurantiacum TaxID=175570 RepID=UPI00194E14FA|nr:sigma-70 family RNA polymerase sigma factor [Virgisporangium aurantiacum]
MVDIDKGRAPASQPQTQKHDRPRADEPIAPRISFDDFFQATYRQLLRTWMYAGATEQEAEDAILAAMEDLYRHWDRAKDPIENPMAYVQQAVRSHFIKARERDRERERRQIKGHGGAAAGCQDAGLNIWEQREWVKQILQSLPPKQGEVLAFVVDGYAPTEIAKLLGRDKAAVRQSLRAARKRLKKALRNNPAAPTSPARKEDR